MVSDPPFCLFMLTCVFPLFPIPLHAAQRAMAAVCRCPCGQQPIFSAFRPESCPQLHASHTGATLPPSPHIHQRKERRKEKQNKAEAKQHLARPSSCDSYSSIPSGAGSDSASTSASAASAWAVGVSVSGALRSLRGGGWGPTSPGGLAGCPLGGAGLGPRPVGPTAVGALNCHMWIVASSPHPAPLNGAPVVCRGGRLSRQRT